MAGPFVVDRNEVVIGAPAQRVFDYLADISRNVEWTQDQGYRETILSDGPMGLGSALRRERDGVMRGPLIIRGGMGDNPVREAKTVTITDYRPYTDLVIETRNSYNDLLASIDRASFHLQGEMEGTRVSMTTEVEPMVPSAFIGPAYAIRVVRVILQRLLGGRVPFLRQTTSVGPRLSRVKEMVETGRVTTNI